MAGDASPPEKQPQDPLIRLDAVIAGLPAGDPLFWQRQGLLEIARINQQISPEQKPAFAQKLVNGALGKIGQEQESHPALFTFLDEVVRYSTEADKTTAQAATIDNFLSPQASHLQKNLAEYMFGLPQMKVDDTEVRSNGRMEFDYCGNTIEIKPPVKGAAKAREVLSGMAVLVEDQKGVPLRLVHLNLPQRNEAKKTIGTACSVEDFSDQFYYGQPVSLESIKQCLDDQDFQQHLNGLLDRRLNQNALSIYARARLRELLQDPSKLSMIDRLFTLEDKWAALSLFHFFQGEELDEVTGFADFLFVRGRKDLAERMFQGMVAVGEFAPGIIEESDYKKGNLRLLEAKVTQQTLEAARLDRDTLTDDDLEIITHSQDVLGNVADAARILATEGKLPVFLPEELALDSRFMLDIFEFSARHPNAKTIFQSLFDLGITVQIAKQEQAEYAGEIADMKTEFYQRYNKDNKMGEEAVTTDPETELTRTESLVLQVRDSLPAKPSALFVGIGKGDRFEFPLMQRLDENHGVKFGKIAAVDQNDYSDEFPKEPEIEFTKGNIKNPDVLQGEKFDLVFLPWSVINDLVEKKGLIGAMQQFQRLVKENGTMILDIPVPIGVHSHLEAIEAQADLWKIWGLAEVDFEGPNKETLKSLFDLMHTRELFMHAVHAGFLPVNNFPLEFDAQQALCDQISKDDSVLTRRHESGEDKNAAEYPFWQTGGEKKYNRATLALRNVGKKQVEKAVGLTPSILVERVFASYQTPA